MSAPVKRQAKDAFPEQDGGSPQQPRRKRSKKTKLKEEIQEVAPAVTKPKKAPKKHRKKNKDELRSSPLAETATPVENGDHDEKSSAKRKKKKKKNKKSKQQPTEDHIGTHSVVKPGHTKSPSKKKHPRKDPRWKLSTPTGGTFIDQDPILADGDQYIIVPTETNVQIYSAKTSLLVRSLYVAEDEPIKSCRLSPTNATQLFVSIESGMVSKWDWTSGQKIQQWQCQPNMLCILEILPVSESDLQDTLITVHSINDHKRTRILQSTLPKYEINPINKDVLFDETGSWSVFRSLNEADILVLCSKRKLAIGNRSPSHDQSKPSYTWRKVLVPEKVVSFDVQTRERPRSAGTRSRMVDIVVGCVSGEIILYEDLLYRLMGKEKEVKEAEILSRRLHWHREAVKTVKWSRDGNYLVSGGSETVLVIWQLDTSQKQFLPHLSTTILNLTISERGSSYALRLADNSIMVLSTADLLPSSSVSGLAFGGQSSSAFAAILNPRHPDQLLAAVRTDSLHVHDQSNSSATFLQTYDIGASRQISRQALVRNMTTVLRVGPDGQRVKEPSVTHIATSHDGQWLITVDEWFPNEKDLDALHSANHQSERGQVGESSLRFWKWQEEDSNWELVTRVDEPHSHGRRTVLGMAANPIKVEVSTIGSDGRVCIWKPLARQRDGMTVKNNVGETLITWACSSSTSLEQISLSTDKAETFGALAYSDDGSAIAASWSWSSKNTRAVHFVNSRTGEVRLTQPNIITTGQAKLAFGGRYLFSLSENFCVWDTVALKTILSISLGDKFISGNSRHLAINPFDGTFALAFNPSKNSLQSEIAIFDLKEPSKGPTYQGKVFGHVRVLLPSVRAAGYVLVDSAARIRHLTTSGVNRLMSAMPAAMQDEATKGLDDIFGARAIVRKDDEDVENDVQQRRITSAFGAQKELKTMDGVLGLLTSSRTLPVREMFQQVIGLFARPRENAG